MMNDFEQNMIIVYVLIVMIYIGLAVEALHLLKKYRKEKVRGHQRVRD